MNLTDFASPLVAENHFVKASFGGFAGSGKSRTASEFVAGVYKDFKCTKPVLVIDNERGARYLQKFFLDHGIPVLIKNTTHLADVLHAFAFLEKGEIDFIFADSLTKVWYQYVRDYKANNNKSRMNLNDWGVIIPEWQERFSDRLVDVKGNIVFTGRGGFEYDMEEDENGRKQFVRSGVKVKLQGETAFETDLNIWMDTKEEVESGRVKKQWREALIMKDRSATIDGKTFQNPTYKHFKPAIDYLMAVPIGTVAGASDTTNLAPPADITPKKKQERDQALESIYASFDQLGISTGAQDKKLKIDLWELVFKTNSKAKVESMKLDTLKRAAEMLVEYKNRMSVLIEEGSAATPELFKETLSKLIVETEEAFLNAAKTD